MTQAKEKWKVFTHRLPIIVGFSLMFQAL